MIMGIDGFASVLAAELRVPVPVAGNASEIRSAEFCLQAVERRHLLAEGNAPDGPQIDQHKAAAPVRKLLGLAVGVLEGEIRQLQGRRRHGNGRDFAMGERRDPFGGIDRGAAGGVAAGAGLCAAKADHSGITDEAADHDRADHDRDPPCGKRERRSLFGHSVCHPVPDTAMQGPILRRVTPAKGAMYQRARM